MQLGLVVIVWLPVAGHGTDLCSALKHSAGIPRCNAPVPTLHKKYHLPPLLRTVVLLSLLLPATETLVLPPGLCSHLPQHCCVVMD